jgi:hypothetical protein
MKKSKKRVIIAFISVFITISVLSAVSFYAEPDDIIDDQVTEEPYYADETDAPVVTEEPYIETEPETEEPYIETEPETEPETEEPYYETEPETEAPYVVETDPQAETPETIDPEYDLPPAPTDPDPTAIHVSQGDNGDLTYGYVSWGCVVVGVLAVIIMLVSNKTHYYGGGGKHRYDEGDKITGQKRLLNDEFYNNRKYNSYYDKDTRK